jgi:hypothetical protein
MTSQTRFMRPERRTGHSALRKNAPSQWIRVAAPALPLWTACGTGPAVVKSGLDTWFLQTGNPALD